MSAAEVAKILGWSGGGVVLLILSFIKFPTATINKNFWNFLFSSIGKYLNSGLSKSIDDIKSDMKEVSDNIQRVEKKLDNHIEVQDEQYILGLRQNILRFSDEIVEGTLHTKEHYDELLRNIDEYYAYCDSHEKFKNSVTDASARNIKARYDEHLQNKDFLRTGHEID